MEYLEILNAVYDELLMAKRRSDYQMRQVQRNLEYVADKEEYIKGQILAIDYEKSAFGHAYINNGYYAGESRLDIREALAHYYECNPIFADMEDERKRQAIKSDAYNFWLRFELEQSLKRLLEPQKEQPKAEEGNEATRYYQKALDVGIIEKTGDGYRKKGITKAQLAYFLQKIFTPDATGKDGRVFPETKLNELFGEKRLGEAVRKLADNKNTGGKPRGYQIIDALFN